jgi:hypothetical protein
MPVAPEWSVDGSPSLSLLSEGRAGLALGCSTRRNVAAMREPDCSALLLLLAHPD